MNNSAVQERSAPSSTPDSKTRLTPQQFAEASGQVALKNLNTRIAKIANGEKVRQQ